eukprot:9350777-Pyramimonas_sp.AAC.1
MGSGGRVASRAISGAASLSRCPWRARQELPPTSVFHECPKEFSWASFLRWSVQKHATYDAGPC